MAILPKRVIEDTDNTGLTRLLAVGREVVQSDGSVPFQRPITGVAPTADAHLATKAYVDAAIMAALGANAGTIDGGIATSTYTFTVDGGIATSTFGGASPLDGGTA